MDLDGSIVCKGLGIKIVNREVIVHRLDTTRNISPHSLLQCSGEARTKLARYLGL